MLWRSVNRGKYDPPFPVQSLAPVGAAFNGGIYLASWQHMANIGSPGRVSKYHRLKIAGAEPEANGQCKDIDDFFHMRPNQMCAQYKI